MKDNDMFYQGFQYYFYEQLLLQMGHKIDSMESLILFSSYQNQIHHIITDLQKQIPNLSEYQFEYLSDIEHKSGIIKCRKPGLGQCDLLFANKYGIGNKLGVSYLLRGLASKTTLYDDVIASVYSDTQGEECILDILYQAVLNVPEFGTMLLDFINPVDYFEIRLIDENVMVTEFNLNRTENNVFEFLELTDLRVELLYHGEYILHIGLIQDEKDETGWSATFLLTRIGGNKKMY